ncbi:Serine/threonine-protein kinase WNK2 [Gracilariopsis chorda]|uniref:non-specific serine/threonine protein kinase n=1 Tax=Gracilariopsis chorda TaxID=448386 RepID=A0A2V3IRH3_9FLOR|nr:Serine/threonine-protein kinase WNK2 [Gracilariopsis chorda]|eukprot:PXF44718.1 Serine/threonine-protein kinase WNK2 [Gracilariopsis chorda]
MTNDSPSADVQQAVETSPNGRYIRYNSILGKGAYKTVYEAFDTEEALQVAWNKLHVDRLTEHDLEKVSNEVSLLRKVTHKNIIKFYDSWRGTDSNANHTINFITEQMMSGTLKEYLRKAQAIKLKVIRRWCSNILDAIAYLHTQTPPIMHRDLKCDNIFINGHVGEVKIGDLGLSGVKEREKADSVIGTPEFMAPELYEESYTEKVDIYAFGMCLLEIVSMEYPYSECTNMAQIFKKVFGGEKPRAFEMLVDGDVKDVIAACLQREPLRPSAVELLKHPLFSEWETDEGSASNLSLVKSSSQSVQAQQIVETLSTGVPIGTDLIDWSDPLQRHMLVRMQEGDNGAGDDHQVSVRASNQNGGFVIGLEIPIRDAIKRVEFTFDPFEDSAQHIAQEMVAEFALGDEQLVVIQGEVERQVKMANDQRDQREALSRNATPQPMQRSTDSSQLPTSVQSANVAGAVLEETPIRLQVHQPPLQRAANALAPQLSTPVRVSHPTEQQPHSSMQQPLQGIPEHPVVKPMSEFPEEQPVPQRVADRPDHLSTEQFNISSVSHIPQENVIVTSQHQSNIVPDESMITEELPTHGTPTPRQNPTSLALPPSVPEYSDQSVDDHLKSYPALPERSSDENLSAQLQMGQQESVINPAHQRHVEGQSLGPQSAGASLVTTTQSGGQQVQSQDLSQSVPVVATQHSMSTIDQPRGEHVLYEGIRNTSFSSRSDLGIQEGERHVVADVGSFHANPHAQHVDRQQTAVEAHLPEDYRTSTHVTHIDAHSDAGSSAARHGIATGLVVEDIAGTRSEEQVPQALPQASSFVSSRPQSSTSVEIPSTSISPHLSHDFKRGKEIVMPVLDIHSHPAETRIEHVPQASPHKESLEVRAVRDVDNVQDQHMHNASHRRRPEIGRGIEIRRVPNDSGSSSSLFVPSVEHSIRTSSNVPLPSHSIPRTLSERPVSSPPIEHSFQATSITQSISDGNLPRQSPDVGVSRKDSQDSGLTSQSPSMEQIVKSSKSSTQRSSFSVPGTETEAMSQAVRSVPGAEMYSFSVHSPRELASEGYNGPPNSRPQPRSGSMPQIVVVDRETSSSRRETNGSILETTGSVEHGSTRALISSEQGSSAAENYSSPERQKPVFTNISHAPPNGHMSSTHRSPPSSASEIPPTLRFKEDRGVVPGRPNGTASEGYPQEGPVTFREPKIDQKSYTNCLKLIDLCSRGRYEEVLDKIERGGASPRFADYDRRTPLHIAAAEGHLKICALLLKRGADVNAKDRWGHTPLWDAKMNSHGEVQELLLIHKGMDSSHSMDETSFELMQYAAKGDLDSVRDRIVAGAEATFQDYDRRSPLHLACSEGHVEVAELLLVNGASHSVRDRMGRSPVDDAVTNGHRKILCLLRQYGATIPPHLLEAQPESVNQKGMDLVEHAARGRIDAVRQYLKQGANPNFGDYDHRTPLHLACVEGRRDVVHVLLQAGAKTYLRDRWGSTPLDEARKGGYTSIVEDIETWEGKRGHQNMHVSFDRAAILRDVQEDAASFDHMSHGIPSSVSMGAITNLHNAADDFAAKYPRGEAPNGQCVEHAPAIPVPQPHLIPVDMFHAAMNPGESVNERPVLQGPLEVNLTNEQVTTTRHLHRISSTESESSLISSGDVRLRASSSTIPTIQSVDPTSLPRAAISNQGQVAGDFRVSYSSVPNGATGDPTRFPMVQPARERMSPINVSPRPISGDRYAMHEGGNGMVLGPNGEVNPAVRLVVDGLIDAAVSER